jgi:hypothetical protein
VKGGRDAMGARVVLKSASGTQHNVVNTAVGYGSSSDPRVHFGLGPDARASEISVTWPTGETRILRGVPAGQVLKVSPR